jgi:crotonobetainyl-CoA:carnitine CoA-transferase CaiB-like acyl-CoA transferase
MTGPLEGVRIADVGTAGVGPWAASILGLLGAQVLKIDSPGGDRHLYQTPLQRGLSTTYTSLNLNKRYAIIDLKDPKMRPAVERIIRQADVIMDNLRPGVIDRMGVGYEQSKEINPRLISASSPAWGESGPFRGIPALDPQVQVFSGFSSLNGEIGGKPEMLRYPHLDFNASCYFASSIVLGLIAREKTRKGQRIVSSHLGSAVTTLVSKFAEYFATGKPPELLGSGSAATAPHRYFRCQDDQILAIGVETEAQWQGFCRAIQRPDLADDPRFTTNRDRVANQEALYADLEPYFASLMARWWHLRLTAEKVPHSFLMDFDRLQYHQQIVENDMLDEIDPAHQGHMYVGRVPWQFSESPAGIRIGGEAPGQSTDEIVSNGFPSTNEIGFPTDDRPHPNPLPSSGEGIAPSTNGATPAAPLTGIRVLDATQGYAGPFCGMLLADAGAEVIKVEPPDGDYSRQFAPAMPDGDSALFVALNRNKRGIRLDLDNEEDRRIYRSLASTCDIVLEDWGPGVAAERGLDYEALSAGRADLIYLALTAFGEKGPFRDQPGSELVLQAWSEYWKNLGWPGSVPPRVATDIAGLGTGVLSFLGVVSAIYRRYRTDKGQRVGISLLSTMMFLRTAQWAAVTDPDNFHTTTYCANGVQPPRYGYMTKDRPIYFGLNNASESDYLGILEDLGMLDDVIDDPRFGNGGRDAVGMGQHSADVWEVWEKYFGRHPYGKVVEVINKHGGSAIEMMPLDEVFEHPQTKSLNLLGVDSAGQRYVKAPWAGPWQQVEVSPPPALDGDREAILDSLKVAR